MTVGDLFRKAAHRARYHRNTLLRTATHGEMVERLASRVAVDSPVFVETGCGRSTLHLARAAKALNAKVYSCDNNADKVQALRDHHAEDVARVEFLVGDSLPHLEMLAQRHERIDFLFLDSAASAMNTFLEFRAIESSCRTGTILLVDNAAIPGAMIRFGPVRKGKILVPYLLASHQWNVTGHPRAGDSMVSAVMDENGSYSDPDYECPDFVGNWRSMLGSGG